MNDNANDRMSRVAAGRALASRRGEMLIWDWPVRFVHWAIVLLLVALLVTGKAGGDWLVWHMRAGETLLALVLFRILWGVTGSRHARFASFVRGPRAVAAYARSLLRPPHAMFAGHNPLGGWMVVLLLVALLVQAGLGLFTNDDIMNEGPLARHVSKDLSDRLSSLHRRNVWVVVGLASVHIVAVLGYLVAFRDDLITPMVTGRKRLDGSSDAEDAGATANRTAVALLLACGIAVWLLVRRW